MHTATRSLILAFALTASAGAQTAMWGGSPGRNQVSDEQNLPTTWNTETGENVKWRATLGSQTYGGPLIVGDKIFVGTNNQAERDPNHKGDRGVVMASLTAPTAPSSGKSPIPSCRPAASMTGRSRASAPLLLSPTIASTISPTAPK